MPKPLENKKEFTEFLDRYDKAYQKNYQIQNKKMLTDVLNVAEKIVFVVNIIMTEKNGNLPKNYFIIHNGGEIMLTLEKGFVYESIKQNKTLQ